MIRDDVEDESDMATKPELFKIDSYNENELSPSEIVCKFVEWITREEVWIDSHEEFIWTEKIKEFCESHNLR